MRTVIPTFRNLKAASHRMRAANRKQKIVPITKEKASDKASLLPAEQNQTEAKEEHWSVLIIGASGTGTEVARHFAGLPNPPRLYAFMRNPARLSREEHALFKTVFQGDARIPMYIERALELSQANLVIVCMDSGDNDEHIHKNDMVENSNVRTASARALARVLDQRQFEHVRAIVVSIAEAGIFLAAVTCYNSKLERKNHQCAMRDHVGQEIAMAQKPSVRSRTTFVRSTAPTISSSNPANKRTSLVTVEGSNKFQHTTTDRSALAQWIVEEALTGQYVGHAVTVTGSRRY